MKKIIILGASLCISFVVMFSCKKNNDIITQQEKQTVVQNKDLSMSNAQKSGQIVAVDNATISSLISLIDATIIYSSVGEINNEALEAYFIAEAEKRNLLLLTSEELPYYSSNFREYVSSIANASRFSTQIEYLTLLENTNNSVLSSDMSNNEKNILVNKIAFMKAFVSYLEQKVAQTQIGMKPTDNCKGWWACWGKCAAGIIGGAGLGTVGGVGVGTVTGTVVLPVIGTIVGGVLWGTIGGISGGLAGATSSCN